MMASVQVSNNDAQDTAKLISALKEFRGLDPEMSIQTILTFLEAAKGQGQSMTELAKVVDVSQSAMSRNIMALSALNRFKKPGHGVLDYTYDTMKDARNKVVTLNPKGRALLARVLSPWRK